MAKQAGLDRIIDDILIHYPGQEKVTEDQHKAFWEVVKELDYSEYIVLRHLATNYDFKRAAKIIDIPEKYLLRKYKRAIRRMRAPIRYYKVKWGLKRYEEKKDEVTGTQDVRKCGFSTKTANVLLRNNLRTIEEINVFVSGVPERFAYIEGLGKWGMSEILYYYKSEITGRMPRGSSPSD